MECNKQTDEDRNRYNGPHAATAQPTSKRASKA
jgi:hypothetical protein